MRSRDVLPTRTVLDGSYRILRVVGSGGFGITYEAEDIGLGTMVAVKEYYPHDFGERSGSMRVRAKSERDKEIFDWGRANFLQEARTLARFDHPSIVRVARVFEANDTAYMVMRFERGKSFEDWLRGLGRQPTQEELDRVVAPMLDALQMLHAADFLHRDIAPDNIIIRTDGTPVLLDFGAARRAVAQMSQALTSIVKAGYSPHEQYSSDSRQQGPWSDIYALGGMLYRAVTGKIPEDATLRFDEDRMPPAAQAAKGKFRPSFLAAIDTCLKLRQSERPRSVAELRPMLLEDKGRGPGHLDAPKPPGNQRPAPPKTRLMSSEAWPVAAMRWPIVVAAVVAISGGVYAGYRFMSSQPAERPNSAVEPRPQPQPKVESRSKEPEPAKDRPKTAAEEDRALLTKKVFSDCAGCPDMVPIPAGEFVMGSSKADIDSGAASGNEGPQRRVMIRQPLAVGRFEVTRDQFEAFTRASGHSVGDKCWTLEGNEPKERDGRSFRNPGYAQLGTHPAVCVSWADAKAYVDWLSKTTGKAYRLLSEAQWEYAARAKTTGRFVANSTETELCGFGNGADQTASAAKLPPSWAYLRCSDGYVHTAPAGTFTANAYGLFDLMGNAWEWTEDCYVDSLADVPTDAQARTTGDCGQHAVRGGAWSTTARMLGLATRGKAPAESRFDDVGFRVARTFTFGP